MGKWGSIKSGERATPIRSFLTAPTSSAETMGSSRAQNKAW
jgi:hypothetical protein